MSYITRYNLFVQNDKHPDFELFEVWAENNNVNLNISWMEFYHDELVCSWYDHDKDMMNLSLRWKELIFCLKGEGERRNDMWVKYYKDGKTYKTEAKITYEDFNESKLK